ncbi:hypothetical protein OIU85_004334 [Salix viminalis]|uniref:IBR domain-containing protein n=1 Tax=Salix viminalis TaxID=40686 RepID=A0A9Q0PSG3_SALVM|nr:hypothetical protein OIU85_004334 [Salix viminalis]
MSRRQRYIWIDLRKFLSSFFLLFLLSSVIYRRHFPCPPSHFTVFDDLENMISVEYLLSFSTFPSLFLSTSVSSLTGKKRPQISLFCRHTVNLEDNETHFYNLTVGFTTKLSIETHGATLRLTSKARGKKHNGKHNAKIPKYIEVTVEETTGCIECPGLNCRQPLDPLSCRRIISKPIFEKWDNLKKIKCPNCKKNFCFLCKIPWHAGYRCNESRHLRDRNDILAGELIEEKKWTRCYNCGHSVERVSGCRDIKCKCGVQFCHQCGGPFHFGPWVSFVLSLNLIILGR